MRSTTETSTTQSPTKPLNQTNSTITPSKTSTSSGNTKTPAENIADRAENLICSAAGSITKIAVGSGLGLVPGSAIAAPIKDVIATKAGGYIEEYCHHVVDNPDSQYAPYNYPFDSIRIAINKERAAKEAACEAPKTAISKDSTSFIHEQQNQTYHTKTPTYPLCQFNTHEEVAKLESQYIKFLDEAAKNHKAQPLKNKVAQQSAIADQKTVVEIEKQKQILSKKVNEFKISKAVAETFNRQKSEIQINQLIQIVENTTDVASICQNVGRMVGMLGGHVETAQKLISVGQAATTISYSAKAITSAPFEFKISTFSNCANFVLGIVQFGMALFGLEEDDDRFTEIFQQLNQIFEAIKIVSQQVMELHLEMRNSFKQLFIRLDSFQKEMQEQFSKQNRLLLHSLDAAHWADTKSGIMWNSLKDAALLSVFRDIRINRNAILNPSIACYLENMEMKDYSDRTQLFEDWLTTTSGAPTNNGYDMTENKSVSDRIIVKQFNENLPPENFYSKLGLMGAVAKNALKDTKQHFSNEDKLINPFIWGMAVSPYLTLLIHANPRIDRNYKHNQEMLDLIIAKAQEVQAFLRWTKECNLFEALWNQYTHAIKEVSEHFVKKLRNQEEQVAKDSKLSDSKQVLGILSEDLRILNKSHSPFAQRLPKDNVITTLSGLNYQETVSVPAYEIKNEVFKVEKNCRFPYILYTRRSMMFGIDINEQVNAINIQWHNIYTLEMPKYIELIERNNVKPIKEHWHSPYLRLAHWLQNDILTKSIETNILGEIDYVPFGHSYLRAAKPVVKLMVSLNKRQIAAITTSHISESPQLHTWLMALVKL